MGHLLQISFSEFQQSFFPCPYLSVVSSEIRSDSVIDMSTAISKTPVPQNSGNDKTFFGQGLGEENSLSLPNYDS